MIKRTNPLIAELTTNMLLAINIGNTNISLGLFQGRHLLKRYSVPTKTQGHYAYLRKIISRYKIKEAVICSVVPSACKVIKRDLTKLLYRKPYIIGKDIKVPIKNLYRNPEKLGQDRLVNAYVGAMLYGAPLVIVDFGTAITFDIVSRRKEYLGGMILPGLGISLEVLAEKTALLPKIKLQRPHEFIGRDTKNSILSGVIYGFACLTDGLIAEIKNKIGKIATVIGTGGNIDLIRRYCRQITNIDKDLTLKGLNLIYINRDVSIFSLERLNRK